jgi:abortive infection bacteriophage resistance protein
MEENEGIDISPHSEEDVKNYLTKSVNFFNLKSYAKLFEKNLTGKDIGKYRNLCIDQLVELSKIDWYLRRLLLNITISIEHFSKINLLNQCTEDSKDDGYQIVADFLEANPKIKEKNKKNASERRDYCCDLKLKYSEDMPVWVLMELLTFGEYVNFLSFYERQHHRKNANVIWTQNCFWSVRIIRNACAHNNCLLPSLFKEPNRNVENGDKNQNKQLFSKLSNLYLTDGEKNLLNRSLLLRDLAMIILGMDSVIMSKKVKNHEFYYLMFFLDNRCIKHKELFTKQENICKAYQLFKKILAFYYEKASISIF